MKQKTKDHQWAVADFVGKERKHDNCDTEASQTATGDGS